MKRLVLATVLALGLPAGLSADWPLFRGDALMSGVGTAKLPDQLDERWTFKTGDSIEGAPAIADGTVYIGSFDKHFYAIDLATGKQKWKLKLGHVKASPSVKGDKVYVGTLNGEFYCLSAADGKEIWKFEAGGEISSGCNFHGTNILIGSHDSTLYCLDANGKKVWEVMTDGLVIAGSRDQRVYALDRKTGAEVWNFETDGMVDGSPVVVGSRVYAGCMSKDGNFYVLDLKTGKKLQELNLDSAVVGSVSVGPDCVLVGTEDGTLFCLGKK